MKRTALEPKSSRASSSGIPGGQYRDFRAARSNYTSVTSTKRHRGVIRASPVFATVPAMLKRLLLVAIFCAVVDVAAAEASTIYPIDRAAILAGSKFDFKVEFDE